MFRFAQKNKLIVIFLLLSNFAFCQNEKVVENIIQKSIDSEKISQYFHGRKPLIILDNSTELKNIKLNKFGEAVKILSKEEIERQKIKAYIEFKYIVTETENASVSFLYKIEGIEAKIEFEKSSGEWEISNIEVFER